MTDSAIVNIYNMSAAMHFDHTEENNLLAYDEWLNITKVMFEISELKKKCSIRWILEILKTNRILVKMFQKKPK